MKTLPELRNLLANEFTQATPNAYFHYVAKMTHGKTSYENEGKALLDMLPKIQEKLQLPNYDLNQPLSEWGFTPLHVAVIFGNEKAISFFIAQKVDLSVRDQFGYTAQEYYGFAKASEVEIKSISKKKDSTQFVATAPPDKSPFPSLKEEEVFANIKRLFATHASSGPRIVNGTDDFEKQFKTLLFPPLPDNASVEIIREEVKSCAEKEGVNIQHTSTLCYARDSLIRKFDGTIAYIDPKEPKTTYDAVFKAFLAQAYFDEYPMFFAHVTKDARTQMGGQLKNANNRLRKTDLSDQVPSFSTFYIEGGNYKVLTNAHGQKKVLIGENHRHQFFLQLSMSGYFDQHPVSPLPLKLSEDEINVVAEEIHALRLTDNSSFSDKDVLGVLVEVSKKDPIEKGAFRNQAIKMKKWKQFDPSKVKNKEKKVALYLAQKEKTMELLAQELGCKKEDIHFVPSLSVHLDIFLQPVPGGILVQDHGLTAEVLKNLKANYLDLGMSSNDICRLNEYITKAEQLGGELKELREKVVKVLKDAGFNPISIPAVYDVDDESIFSTFKTNFLNAVTGYSEKNQRPFYITGAFKTPDSKVDALLMKVFTLAMQNIEKQMQVYFVGQGQAAQCWNFELGNFLNTQAGIGCMTFEL